MQECAQLAGEHRGAESPEVPTDDDAVRPAAKRDHPATAGPIAVVVLLVDLDVDLIAPGTARA